ATAELFQRDPHRDLRVVICGGASGGSSKVQNYHDLAKELGVAHRIRFLDARPPEELVAVYQAADIIAVPSYNESFGLLAVEHYVTSCLIDGHDPSLCADSLVELLDDDQRRIAMGEEAVRHADKFSWAASAQQLLKVYEHVTQMDMSECHGPRQATGI